MAQSYNNNADSRLLKSPQTAEITVVAKEATTLARAISHFALTMVVLCDVT